MENIFKILDEVNPPKRWCSGGACGCLGCANRMPYYTDKVEAKLGRMVTEDEYNQWVKRSN